MERCMTAPWVLMVSLLVPAGVGTPAALAQASTQAESDAAAAVDRDQAMSGTDQEARAIFMAAQVAFDEGRFESAVQYFLQSFRLSGRPELLYNIGNTYDRLQQPEQALHYFDQYLQQRPNAENNKQVEARTRLLRQAVDQRRTSVNTPVAVPTPEQTAQAHAAATEPLAPSQAPPAATASANEGGSSWLLWTGLGTAVVAATIVTVVMATGGTTTQDPLLPSDGVAVRRL